MAGMRKRITFPLAGPILLSVVLAACIPATFGGPAPSGVAGDASASVAATPVPMPAGPSGRPSFVRPTPTPLPTFLAYVVKRGDTLTSIARAHGTTARSIAFWNRGQHPSLDPDSPSYSPNRIEVGWILLLVPDTELDPEDLPPEPAPSP
jgi:LysM domain-containing protein